MSLGEFMSETKYYSLAKYLDVILEKPEIALSKTEFEINPGITFYMTISNNSDRPVELERLFLIVKFRFPLKEGGEDFVTIGKGYAIVKDVLNSGETRQIPIFFEMPHSKVVAIQKALREAKSIEGKLIVFAYFMRVPSILYATPLEVNPQSIIAWNGLPSFPPFGRVVKRYNFVIPIEKWNEFVDKVSRSLQTS